MRLCPSLRIYRQLMVAGRGGDISFSGVVTGLTVKGKLNKTESGERW